MKRISWKYIAGFVDGEGNVGVQTYHNDRAPSVMAGGGSYIRPLVRITQALPGRDVLVQLQTNFGGNLSVRNKGGMENPNWSEYTTWTLAGRKGVRPFLQNIVNHLYIKKQQARFVIWVIDNVLDKNVGPEARQVVKDELSAMRSDPQRLSERAQERVLSMVSEKWWSKHSRECLGCASTEVAHYCQGFCKPCYDKHRWASSVRAMRQSGQTEAVPA